MNTFINSGTRRLLAVLIAATVILSGFPVAFAETQSVTADSANEQITSGDIEDAASIPSSEVPRAGGNVNTIIPNDDVTRLDMALMVLAAVCLTAVCTLGFLVIKRKREERKEREETKKA